MTCCVSNFRKDCQSLNLFCHVAGDKVCRRVAPSNIGVSADWSYQGHRVRPPTSPTVKDVERHLIVYLLRYI